MSAIEEASALIVKVIMSSILLLVLLPHIDLPSIGRVCNSSLDILQRDLTCKAVDRYRHFQPLAVQTCSSAAGDNVALADSQTVNMQQNAITAQQMPSLECRAQLDCARPS